MSVPSIIYRLRLSNVILINLFVMANDRRFKEVMASNIRSNDGGFDWFMNNQELTEQVVASFGKEFEIGRAVKGVSTS
jgi:hypothetical protein